MKLIVALALAAARVWGSEAPCFLEFVGDCAQLSGVCQTFDTRPEFCQGRNTEPGDISTEDECERLFGNKDVEVNWCPFLEPEKPEKPDGPIEDRCAPEFKDCAQFSSVCQVFVKSQCKTKNKGKLTEKECDAKNDVSEFARGTTEWCPEASPEQLEARCKRDNQCIIRNAGNGKLIRKQKTSDDCKEASLYDCALRGECAPLYDCAPFSSVCLVFDKESCLVNDDASLTEAECKDKNDEDSGFVGGTAQWCP